MFHGLLIYLPVEGHLNCFQFLMTMNKAAVNLCVQEFCEHRFLFHLCKYLAIDLVSHIVSLHLAL